MRANGFRLPLFSGLIALLLVVVGVLALSGQVQAAYPATVTAQGRDKADGPDSTSATPALRWETCLSCTDNASNHESKADKQNPEPGQATGCTTSVNLVLDDGTVENSVGWTTSTQSFTAIWFNRSSPPAASFPMNLTQISIKWPNSAALVGKTVALLVYVDEDADGDPADAVKVAQVNGQAITVANGTTFQDFPISANIPAPGDVYYGFADTYNSGGVSPRTFPAPLDTSATQGRSWVAAQDTVSDPPDFDNLGNNDHLDTIDSLSGGALTGNWVIRASGTGGACPTATPTATSTACPIQFVDAGPSTPFYEYIRCLACRGVLGGYSGSTNCPGGSPCFRPNDNITRGQIAKIVSNAAGYNDAIPGSQQSFADVPSSNPFWLFIERVHDHGAISGYPCDGTNGEPTSGTCYRPGNNLTRGQLAKIATSVAGYSETPSGQTFNDVPPSQPFYVYIERAVLHGIISGYPCGEAPGEICPGAYFRPGVNVTRGQAAKIIAGTFFPGCTTPARK
ncbi:MAG TPA: S-layer homology domain-containing protein [Chloroflexia bacterium]